MWNCSSYCSSKSRDLNVLLINIDALRPDHLGCYGYKRNTSSNIDKLAKEGVLFLQAISQGSWTLPSTFSLISSRYPHEYGVFLWGEPFDPSFPTLDSLLKKEDYNTKLISNHPGLTGFAQCFDSVEINDHLADVVTQKAICFLRERKGKFFLWLHYVDAHGPYRPPTNYRHKYLNDGLYKQDKHLPISTNPYNSPYFDIGAIPLYVTEDGITDVDYYVAQYDSEISFVDEQIGTLLKALKELGLDKKTIIVLTSDHGELLGEHNIYFTHGGTLYDATVKVPLIFKCKGLLPAGRIIDEQVGHIDIMPTILDLLKVKAEIKMRGINLMPFILKKNANFPRKIIVSENFDCDPENFWEEIVVALRTEEWKIYNSITKWKFDNSISQSYELYNIKNDPKESVNLNRMEKEKFRFLKKESDQWMNNIMTSKVTIISSGREIDEQTRERLKNLGYLQ